MGAISISVLYDINQIVDVLKNLSERGIKCNLLVGAGCSVSAGIPTAEGIIEIIKQKFPSIYSMVKEKSYANCMNSLSPDERIDLIKGLVSNAKLNISHVIIAQLLKDGYVHRVLTPNFDNLLIKACSIVNEYPPIYDLAAYEEFKPEHIPEKCIFYLHGQFTGFKLMNTNEEVIEQAKRLDALFHRLNERSVWIIVGYSGVNDALFQLLSKETVFANRLFWIGYNEQAPNEALRNNILKQGKYGFYLKGYDSDSFFWNLAKKVGEFPPTFLLRPFSYIKNLMEQIVPYQPRENSDLNKPTISIIENAIDKYEKDPNFMAECYFTCGLYDEVIKREESLLKKKRHLMVSNSYFLKALEMYREANEFRAIDLYKQAINLYDRSNKISRYHGCFNNSGLCYYKLAEIDCENMAEHIFESLNRYLISLEISSNERAYNNFLEAVMLLLNNVDNKKFISEINKKYEIVSASKIQGDYIEWTNLVLSKLATSRFNKPLKFDKQVLEQYLGRFLKLVEEKFKQSA